MSVKAFYSLLKMPLTYAMDTVELTSHYHEAMAQVHPDKFAHLDSTARRVAQSWAVRIQEAYGTLLDPIKRASLWCDELGSPVKAETNTAMPMEFLMMQMHLHEVLEEGNLSEIEALVQSESRRETKLIEDIAYAIDSEKNGDKASTLVRELMFVTKWLTQAKSKLDIE